MQERIIAWFFLVVFLAAGIRAVQSYNQAKGLLQDEARMHVIAYRHGANGNAQHWKHDERLLLVQASHIATWSYWELVGAACALGAALLAWYRRPAFRRPKSYSYGSSSGVTAAGRFVSSHHSEYNAGRHTDGEFKDARSAEYAVDETYEDSLQDKRKESGRRGELEVYEALLPLIAEGWELLERNPTVEVEGRKYGDIDFILRSPRGIGYSIDAKNANAFAWVHNNNLYFKHRWYKQADGSAQQWFYPLERAWLLADWVKTQERYAVTKVRPLICLTKQIRFRNLRNAAKVIISSVDGLCDKLREVDERPANFT